MAGPDAVLKLGGVEFYGVQNDPSNYTGAAVLSGNVFLNNTLYGIYIGSAHSPSRSSTTGSTTTSWDLPQFPPPGYPFPPVNAIIQGNRSTSPHRLRTSRPRGSSGGAVESRRLVALAAGEYLGELWLLGHNSQFRSLHLRVGGPRSHDPGKYVHVRGKPCPGGHAIHTG